MENLKRRKGSNCIFMQLLLKLILPKNSVHEIIKQNRYHPYKMIKNFIAWLVVTYESNFEILQNLLWTNECKFSNNDVMNRCNHYFWSKDNSYWF
ncbi:hypothetical protein ALC56_00211 [Trachymyrmex septentrionalis]|uniref:Uncharacterized protein n=1 Tax=Trachymyrmex septentrionalis TaxID=34720 RepID=A0A195FZY8_9HYME|nr:hypothetical protein ALC56_00211 [Trachymyrmex septentrionalis]